MSYVIDKIRLRAYSICARAVPLSWHSRTRERHSKMTTDQVGQLLTIMKSIDGWMWWVCLWLAINGLMSSR